MSASSSSSSSSASASSSSSRVRPAVVLGGLALGVVLSRLGFTDWGELHGMLTLSDLRLVGAFGIAVVVTAIGLRLLKVGALLPDRPWHGGIIPGALLFGVGWALSGACPGAAIAQLGEGRLTAVVSVVGVAAGSALYQAIARIRSLPSASTLEASAHAPAPPGVACA